LPGDRLFAPIFSTDALLEATSDRSWLQAMLDAEAALAWAQADCDVIPAGAATAILAACDADRFDLGQLGRDARRGGNPVIPLVPALRAAVADPWQVWVHWGATSQDILDTAAMLVTRRAVALIDADLARLGAAGAALAEAHRDTVMAGRTLLQQALPITLGLKAAGWLAGTDAARGQLARASADLAVQLGGAAGTLASLGTKGPAVAAAFARRLGLAEPVLPWHTTRGRIAALAGALGLVAGTAAKISLDVALLMQTEVGEAFEPTPGGSSTLPHKRNPASGAAVVAAARRAHALLPVLFGALVAEHERPVGAWHAEWQPLSELLALAGGAAAGAADTLDGLDVDPQAMARNVARTGGALLSERVVLALAEATGDGDEGRRAVTDALRSGRPFADALADDPLVAKVFDRARIDELLDPAGYLGATATWIDRALAAHAEASDPRSAKEVSP
jgi:3-carboxy-cis,cis-muconate cycloisomerase